MKFKCPVQGCLPLGNLAVSFHTGHLLCGLLLFHAVLRKPGLISNEKTKADGPKETLRVESRMG